jgi:surface antigen
MIKTYAAAAMASLMLAGCAQDSGPKETSGALIGGLAGGLLGNTIGHGNGRAAATVLGAALGAVVGGKVGRSLDDEDRNYAYGAATRSFTSGREVTWENEDSGHRGRFRMRLNTPQPRQTTYCFVNQRPTFASFFKILTM